MSTVYLGFLASFDARPEKEYILFWTDNYYYQRYLYICILYEVIILKGTKLVSSSEGPFVRYSPTGEVSSIFSIYDIIIISNYYGIYILFNINISNIVNISYV